MVDVYTDGSCSGNPGPGGWGAVVLKDGKPQRISGHDPHTTNNRMELTAAIKALEAVSKGTPITVHSDSEYLIKTMTKGWKRNANQD
ncbi:MAG: ribonuclease HI, partial [Chloroflexi bacterium]|nr:ribonuclease HI [Chloroflexota bacterium]